jgi:hypothetical protein
VSFKSDPDAWLKFFMKIEADSKNVRSITLERTKMVARERSSCNAKVGVYIHQIVNYCNSNL